jgi:hypothetical protein
MAGNALILLSALFLVQAAHADAIKDALNHKYKKHILALRSSFTAGDQKFDSAGNPVNAAPSSSWLLYGGIYVEKLNLSSDTVRVQGPLAAYADQKKDGQRVLVRFSKSRSIEIHLDQPLKSVDDAEAVMGRIFFLGADAAEHAKPELRRPVRAFRTTKFTTTIRTVLQLPKAYPRLHRIFPKKLARQNFREKSR